MATTNPDPADHRLAEPERNDAGIRMPGELTRGAWWRGVICSMSFTVAPLGKLLSGPRTTRREAERLKHGLTFVFPGIESQSFFTIGILDGLIDGGVPGAVQIFDWTTGLNALFLYHLRAARRNHRIAAHLADLIRAYRAEHPEAHVFLVGHSGGGGMALGVAEQLGEACPVDGLILLAPAVSSHYRLRKARRAVKRGIWNFCSSLDCLLLGLGTTVAGTFDGRHTLCAGMIGFAEHERMPEEGLAPVYEVPYSPRFARWFHFGGHFGCANRVFVEAMVAPILRGESMPEPVAQASARAMPPRSESEQVSARHNVTERL